MTSDIFWTGFYEFMTLLSLGLTPPAIVASIVTAWKWRHDHTAYMRSENPTAAQTINAGIFRGFVGAFVDNLWWGFAWSFDYLGMEGPRNFFFTYGVFSNVFFRQIATTWAGSLHIRAEAMSISGEARSKAVVNYWKLVGFTCALSFAFVLFLTSIK